MIPAVIGTWGTGIFDDDVAADVRDAWTDAMDAGLSPQDATTQVVEGIGDEFIEDADDGPVFWLVLASLQLEAGALDADVAERAKAAIPSNSERWRKEASDDDFESRRQVLGALQQRLPA